MHACMHACMYVCMYVYVRAYDSGLAHLGDLGPKCVCVNICKELHVRCICLCIVVGLDPEDISCLMD